MSRRDPLRIRDYLTHILQASGDIRRFTAGMDVTAYLADSKTQHAVIRNFEVIGEACNKVATLHPQFALAHSDVPWTLAYEMRNALAHGYFQVDHEILWETIQSDLPKLDVAVARALTAAPN